MKKLLLSLTCVTGLVASAGAQVFQPETARNILIGSIAGAIIGENNDKPLEGALIGAAAGGLWSAATVPAREHRSYAPPVPEAPRHRDHGYHRRERSCDERQRVIIVTPSRCEPPPRRVVVIEPACPPTRRVDHYRRKHRDCDDRVVVVPPRGRVVYVTPGYGYCR